MKNRDGLAKTSLKSKFLLGTAAAGFRLGAVGLCFGAVGVLTLISSGRAFAYTYTDGNTEINLTTTVQYSGAVRVNKPSTQLLTNVNTNDGDQNFQHGMISNQFEIVPILSITNGNFGLHLSGEAFVDPSYLQQNTNDSAGSLNYSVSNHRDFNRSTTNIDGRNAELLDAFAYDSVDFGANDAQSITVKVGRQTLLWGQSLFFSGNGVAAGQAPVDINKALTLANPQAQQLYLPVGQAVLTYQPNNWITLQGYYQFEWRYDQFPGAGSYFAPADFVVPGGTQLIAPLPPQVLAHFPPPFRGLKDYFGRTADTRTPSSNGQFGVAAKFQIGNYDLGVYALRFDDKSPQFYLNTFSQNGPPHITSTGLELGTYKAVYARDIQVFGASFSTDVGPVNVAGEVSGRRHQDLDSNPAPYTPALNENSNPGYAVGDTLNGQVSAIYLSPGLPFMPGGMSMVGEIEANRVLEVTANKAMLVPGRTANAIGMQGVMSPTYYDVGLANLNLSPAIGITWYPTGRSEIFQNMQAGTGQLNIGLNATYDNIWKAGINYADFLGSTAPVPPGGAKQIYADRGYLSFYLSRTF